MIIPYDVLYFSYEYISTLLSKSAYEDQVTVVYWSTNKIAHVRQIRTQNYA